MFRAEEDYIKLIYTLTIENSLELVKTTTLAKRLNHSNQTIIEMVKKLEQKGFVEYYPYKGVKLTEVGKREAIRMIRAHRVWEVFLTEKLGFDWNEVHQDVELLEHASSKKIIDALYRYLNEPMHCQHGNPIPTESGQLREFSSQTMIDEPKKGRFLIERFQDEKDVTSFLNKNNLSIGDVINIEHIDLENNILITDKNKMKITKKIATSIYGKWV